MELYTSCWKNFDLAGLDVIPVGISRGVPRGALAKRLPYRYRRLVDLAPPTALCNGIGPRTDRLPCAALADVAVPFSSFRA